MKVATLEKLSIESVKLNEGVNDNKLILQIKAIHNGMTRNLTNYTSDALKNSLDSWTQPYQKKVLKNHDINAEPLGRIISATYSYDEAAHKDAVMLTAEITDPDAIQKIMDKRYSTVSVGGTSNSVVCSICGTDIAKDGMCEHYKGEFYDGDLAFWNIQDFDPDEISFVNAPADVFAGVSEILDDPMQKPPLGTVFNQSTQGTGKPLQENDNSIIDKGGQTMPTVEELQAKLAESEAALATKTTELEAKTTELETKTAELETKTTEAADNATKLEEANTQIATLTESVNTLTAENATLTEEVSTVKAEKEAIETQVVETRTSIHKAIAEKVAMAKVFLGKITTESVEAEVEELIKRSEESLKDSFSDLIKELKPTTVVEKLEDPTKTGDPVPTHESVEFESKSDYAEFLTSEMRKLFK